MKSVHLASVLGLCILVAACGNSTTTSTDDALSGTDDVAGDATGSDTLGNDGTDNDAPLPDTLSYKYPTCAAVADCAQAACAGSSSASCASECLANGAPSALPGATALLTCVQTQCVEGQCKSGGNASCLQDCTSLRCMPKIFDCIEDGKTGTKGCADVKTCFDTCNASKTNVVSCLQTCYGSISAAGKAKAKPFATCVASAPAGSDPTASCMKETFGCFLDGKTGAKGCFDSIGCLTACGTSTDQFSCALGCFGDMTQAAQTAYLDVTPCLGKDITATAGCEDKLVVCLAPTGTQTCAESLGCAMGCNNSQGDNDPSCMFTCLHNTTAAADKLLLEHLGCNSADPTCTAGIIQCLAPSGTSSCPVIIACAMGCSTGQGQPPDMKCLLACIQKGSTATATTAYATLNCMGKTATGCADTTLACYNPSGTASCNQTLSCVQSCYAAGGDVTTCQNGCFANASVQGFKDFEAWSSCQQTCSSQCKNDPTCTNSCMSTQCPAAKSTCQPT